MGMRGPAKSQHRMDIENLSPVSQPDAFIAVGDCFYQHMAEDHTQWCPVYRRVCTLLTKVRKDYPERVYVMRKMHFNHEPVVAVFREV